METETNSLVNVARHLATALSPLRRAFSDISYFRSFMRRIGWGVESLPAEYVSLVEQVEQLINGLEALNKDSSPSEALQIIEKTGNIYKGIKALSTAPAGVDAAAFLSEMPKQVFELLLVDYITVQLPRLFHILQMLGVIQNEAFEATAERPAYVLTHFRFEEIPEILKDPLSIPGRVYGWGRPEFNTNLVNVHLLEIFTALGIPATLNSVARKVREGYRQLPDDDIGRSIYYQVRIPIFELGIGQVRKDVGIKILGLPAGTNSLPGIILEPMIPLGIDPEFQFVDQFFIRLREGFTPGELFGIVIRPGELFVHHPFQPGSGSAAPGFGVAVEYKPETSAILLGSEAGSRLQVAGWTASIDLDDQDGQLELRLGFAPQDLKLVVAAADLDGFLSQMFGDDDRTIPITLGARFSNRTGFGFIGGAGLELSLHPHLGIGPIRIEQVDLGIKTTADSEHPPDLKATVGLIVAGDLGPVSFSVDGIGLAAALQFSEGNAGPFDIQFGFAPPKGAGLAVDASIVKGGGFLRFDPDKGEYSGILQLEVAETIAVKAVGLLTTRMPDGSKGFSLVLIVTAEGFAPIQLGLGFTLTGIGGLLGINRTVSVDVLRTGLKNGTLGSVMFPPDPIRNAPQIVSDLRTVFPPVKKRHVFGPMATICWGTPTILSLELALILELPEPVRLIILGRLKAILPDERAPLVQVRMDAIGVIDFNKGDVSLDATLYDSRILEFTLTGDMALRASWGAKSSFILAVGGFNPRFLPPAGFPKLNRLALDLSKGDALRLQCAAYLALTSNTVQFGARISLHAAGGGFTVDGYLGVDALFQFAPFAFVVDISAGVALRYHGHLLMGISLNGSLSGPTPWHVKGKASFDLLFFSVSVSVDHRFGRDEPAALPAAVDVLGLLTAAISDARNWSSELPRGEHPLVTFREQSDTTTLRAHPLAVLTVRQRVVPLNMTIDTYGNAPVSGANRFTLEPRRADGSASELPLTFTVTQDSFGIAQFLQMSDDERLSRPSFESRDAGIRFGSDQVDYHYDPLLDANVEYETQMVVPGQEERPPTPPPVYVMRAPILDSVVITGAAGQAPIRRTGNSRYRTIALAA